MMGTAAFAQDITQSQMDSIKLGNQFGLQAGGNVSQDASVFDRSPEVDIAKALYGQFSGLLVKQGAGRSEENQSKLRLHGHSPLILVDGFAREINDLTGIEIESISVLKDAAAAALYGVKGANGVVMITTKRGKDSPLKVTAKYQQGLAFATRTPEFADAYTYAYFVNQASELDGITPRYTNADLNGFYASVNNPATADLYAYPNVDWWSQIYRGHGDNYRSQFTFEGGNRNFRYFTAVDYLKDNAMYVTPSSDKRYNGHVYDNRLGIRANVDVNITNSTAMKIGVMARLTEFNKTYYQRSGSIDKLMYKIPSAAFPIKHADGTYGGSAIYGSANPVAQFQESGQGQYSQPKVLANMVLLQDLSSFLPGLSADVAVAFDYIGKMTEVAYKEFQYEELVAGTPKKYGTNSKTVEYEHWFSSLAMKFEMQGRLNYTKSFGDNRLDTHLAYRQRSWIEAERNESSKTQEILATASYAYKDILFVDAVANYSGSAYLEPGKRFNFYPAVNVAAVVMKEPFFVKAFGSAGLSGSDGDLEHELWRQAYGSSNGHSYNFGTAVSSYSGRAEGNMAALTLAPEQAATFRIGAEASKGGFTANLEAFYEDRSKQLIEPANISGVIGIGMSEQSLGESIYKGVDFGVNYQKELAGIKWNFYGNGGLLLTKVIDDGQAYQPYPYLYHKGNSVYQCYGLEAIGYFKDQAEIDASPKQTFGDVRPGDLKYKDQNGDDVIDSQDRVKMAGPTYPVFQYGFGLSAQWNRLGFFADFQGAAGVTVSLLDSPLYTPLTGNSTISMTYLNREIPWTAENASTATMPRLTTLDGDNNYRSGSQWYRDGSFLKLRNIGVSYAIPRSLMKICDATVTLSATNLFSIDSIGFADPEQLAANYPATRVFWAGVKFNF